MIKTQLRRLGVWVGALAVVGLMHANPVNATVGVSGAGCFVCTDLCPWSSSGAGATYCIDNCPEFEFTNPEWQCAKNVEFCPPHGDAVICWEFS